ncbi:MAG: hypothetical protein IIX01_05380 [Clostridia bacterium]|nr:hypothetical protein [Clostridia bacterium]
MFMIMLPGKPPYSQQGGGNPVQNIISMDFSYPFGENSNKTVGIKVTLRGERMYNFYDKFVSIALPRLRDFRGVSDTAFDGRGNYSVGLKEQLIFPEITYDQVEKIRGMDVAIVTTANTDEEARELLRALGMPFKK